MRIIVEKATGKVVDAGSPDLKWDDAYYFNLDYPDGTIALGENPRKHMRAANGNIVKRPQSELAEDFPEEARADLLTTIASATTVADLKQGLIKLVNRSRF